MIKIENVDISGFEAAICGMRNPMNTLNLNRDNFDFAEKLNLTN